MRELTPDTTTDAVLDQVATTPKLHLKQQGPRQWEPTIRLVRRPA